MDNIIIDMKDKVESMVINDHKDSTYFHEKVNEMKDMLKYVNEKNYVEKYKKIIMNIEKAVLLSQDKRSRIIEDQFEETKNIALEACVKTLDNLQNKLKGTNITEFKIISKTEYDLILAGSFDFAYYHDVEIIFSDVEFIFCPGYSFNIDKFRLATQKEILEISKFMNGYADAGIVICLEDTYHNEKYFIVTQQVNYKFGLVFYYNRENLQPGERIADWVKLDSE